MLNFDAADRLGGDLADSAGVVAAQVDGGDVDGDDAAGVDAPQRDLLPGDHDDAGVFVGHSQPGLLRWPVRASAAEPLNPDNEHEVIRWVDQERDESLMMLAEMQRAQ